MPIGDVLGVSWSQGAVIVYKGLRGCKEPLILIKENVPKGLNAGDSFDFEETKGCGEYRLRAVIAYEKYY